MAGSGSLKVENALELNMIEDERDQLEADVSYEEYVGCDDKIVTCEIQT